MFKKLNIKKIIVGYDFKFGKDRKGNIDLLKLLRKPIVEYIFTSLEGPRWSGPSKRNQKLLDRANKALKKKRQ